MALTPKRAAFVREYLIDLNASAAARRAGYSARTANRAGHELLSNPDIAAAVQEAQEERAESTGLSAQMVIDGLRREAETAGSDAARVAAWAHLGKHLGMFTDRVEHSGGMTIEVVYVDED